MKNFVCYIASGFFFSSFSNNHGRRPNRVTSLRRIFHFFLVDKTEINETTSHKGSAEVANAQSLSSILNDRGHVTHTTGVRTIGKHKVNPLCTIVFGALVMYFLAIRNKLTRNKQQT